MNKKQLLKFLDEAIAGDRFTHVEVSYFTTKQTFEHDVSKAHRAIEEVQSSKLLGYAQSRVGILFEPLTITLELGVK